MADQGRRIGIESMPTEITVRIFNYLESGQGVHSLLQASKTLYNTYTGSTHHIAKEHILRQFDSDDYKLAVMAVESRKVNPFDLTEVETFFNDYLHRREWDIKLFRMDTAYQIPELKKAAELLVDSQYGLKTRVVAKLLPETPTERARKIRSLYMNDIFLNLFHLVPARIKGVPSRILPRAPYPDMVKRFWLNFAPAEIAQVQAVRSAMHFFYVALSRKKITLPVDQHGPGCKCNDEGAANKPQPAMKKPSRPVSWVKYALFTVLTDLQRFYRWCCPTGTGAEQRSVEYYNFCEHTGPRAEQCDPFMTAGIIRRLTSPKPLDRSRFYDDPESQLDKYPKLTISSFNETDGIRWPYYIDCENKLYRLRVLSDHATLEKLRELVHANDKRVTSWGLVAI
ncbi:hypothetical protein F4774DRAFT_425602 [Daldinia eschscholtzii]|nr:hypothetical protein F4774DRAFT_425602 [Daldinia eschscholtzii]